jgi:hypothetical protein
MIGYILTQDQSAAITEAIRTAQTSRGLSPYWLLVGVPITSGPHVGKCFLPCDDAILSAPLHGGTKPTDYPEFETLVASLGGLEARQEITPEEIAQPVME